MPPQRPHHGLKIDALFVNTLFKRSQIFRISGQCQFHSVIDHVRNGTISSCRLESQGSMNLGFEINSCSFGETHKPIITLGRHDVMSEAPN